MFRQRKRNTGWVWPEKFPKPPKDVVRIMDQLTRLSPEVAEKVLVRVVQECQESGGIDVDMAVPGEKRFMERQYARAAAALAEIAEGGDSDDPATEKQRRRSKRIGAPRNSIGPLSPSKVRQSSMSGWRSTGVRRSWTSGQASLCGGGVECKVGLSRKPAASMPGGADLAVSRGRAARRKGHDRGVKEPSGWEQRWNKSDRRCPLLSPADFSENCCSAGIQATKPFAALCR